MRQSDFSKSRTRLHLRRKQRLLRMAIRADLSIFLSLLIARKSRRVRRDLLKLTLRTRHITSCRLILNIYSERTSVTDFRFKVAEIALVSNAMGWNSGKTRRSRYKCPPMTATCIFLRRMASPCRWVDLECVFGMHTSALSEVFWEVAETFYGKRKHLLTQFRSDLMYDRAELYAEANSKQGAPLENCVGFIDCSRIAICRPGGVGANQRSVYSGHKRFHCFIYQTITTPDGLIFHLYGPEEGRRHDPTLYHNSDMGEVLSQGLLINNKQYCIYGDPAYMLKPWLQVGFPSHLCTEEQTFYNKSMSAIREAV